MTAGGGGGRAPASRRSSRTAVRRRPAATARRPGCRWRPRPPAVPRRAVPAGPHPAAAPSRPVTPPGLPPYDTPQPYALLMRARDWAWWRPLLGLLLFAVVYGVAGDRARPGRAGHRRRPRPGAPRPDRRRRPAAHQPVPDRGDPDRLAVLGGAARAGDRLVVLGAGPAALAAVPALDLACAGHPRGRGRGRACSSRWRPPGSTSPAPGRRSPGCCWWSSPPRRCRRRPRSTSSAATSARRSPAGSAGRGSGRPSPRWSPPRCSPPPTPPPDFQTFLYRFAIGLALSAAVWLTGGLEASIALHAVNNVVIFLLAGAAGRPGGRRRARRRRRLGHQPARHARDGGLRRLGRPWPGARLRPELLSPAVDLRGPRGRPWPGVPRRRRSGSPPVPGRAAPAYRRLRGPIGYSSLPAPKGAGRPLGYGVIGSPTVSGSVSLGSSPGTPARKHHLLRTTAPPQVSTTSSTWPRRLAAQDAALSRR